MISQEGLYTAALCRDSQADQLFCFMRWCENKRILEKGCTSKAWEMYGEANCPRCGNPRLSHRLCLSSPGQAASSLLSGEGDGW